MKLIKKLVIVLIALLVITVISPQVIVNMPFVKDKIKNAAEKALERPVSIESLRVHFLKGFSLTLNNFYIYEKDKKTIFAGLKSLNIGMELIPLLSKKVNISSIIINKPEVTIIQYKNNQYNFSDITQSSSSEEKTSPSATSTPTQQKSEPAQKEQTKYPSISIGNVIINDASLAIKQEAQDGAFKEFSLTGLSLEIKDFSFDKPLNFNLTSNLNKNASIKCKINTSSIQNITNKPDSAEFDINANIDKLNSSDLSGILSPETLSSMAFSELECAANIKGSIEKGLNIEGTISTAPLKENLTIVLNKAKLKCFAEKNTTQNNPNAKLLETVKIDGSIDADSITYKNNTLSNMHIAINGEKGTLSLKDISAEYSGGTIRGDTSFGIASTPSPFAININAAGIQIKDAMAANTGYDKLSGSLKADIALRGKGFDTASINQNLSGKADLSIANAVFTGKNLKEEILKAMENPLLAQAFPGLQTEKNKTKEQKKETKISNLAIKTTLGNTVCNVNTFTCQADSADINGNGAINFDLNSDLKIQMVLSKEFTQMLLAAEAGKEKELPNYLPQENGQLILPATITGSIKDPTVMPDLSVLISSLTKGTLQDSLGNALGGKGETGEKKSGIQNTLGNILGGGGSGKESSGEKKSSPFNLF